MFRQVTLLAIGLATLSANSSDAQTDDFQAAIAKARRDILAFYPVEGRSKGLDGTATITCQSDPHGAARNCALNSESPSGTGFGDAALKIAAASVDYSDLSLSPEQAAESRLITFQFKSSPFSIEPNPLSPIRVIEHPHFSNRGQTIQRIYPDRAMRENIGGAAVLHCKVGATGAVGECLIDSETPDGYGFGKAAENEASFLTLVGDEDALGLPTVGATVILNFRFQQPPR